MPTVLDDLLPNPYWHALRTEQAALALGGSRARRFPADILPFAGLADHSPEALAELATLVPPGEILYLTAPALPPVAPFEPIGQLPAWQMVCDAPSASPPATPGLRPLHAADVPAMLALIHIAFPGFFRERTHTLGTYLGVFLDGQLAAMAGERLALPGAREVSAVCTHPAHTGKGLAAALIRELLAQHRHAGLLSLLHVGAENQRAIQLYTRLGFRKTRPLLFHRLLRKPS